MREFERCPLEYRANCALYEIECKKCAAYGNTEASFKYTPISHQEKLAYRLHPYYLWSTKESRNRLREERRAKLDSSKHKEGVKSNRVGRKVEKRIIDEIGATPTVASGARTQKGDAILTVNGRAYRVEHKTRMNGKNILGPRGDEWRKAKNQGIDIFIVTDDISKKSIVTMELSVFNGLIGEIDAA